MIGRIRRLLLGTKKHVATIEHGSKHAMLEIQQEERDATAGLIRQMQ